jgi:dephospho-CoA kinase
MILGITGGIACGKSEVGSILENMGFAVCDTDRVAHGLMRSGTPVYRSIVDVFGEQVLSDDGEISREYLGRIVFEDPGQLSALNRLVHPAVRDKLESWMAERRKHGENAAAQIPLLFESGMQELDWDGIICVSSLETEVIKRLAQRGLQEQEVRRRIAAQMLLSKKEDLSDCVIHNDGTLQELERTTRMTVERLIAER